MSDPEYWDDRRLERRFAAVLVVPGIGVTIIAMIVFAVSFRVIAHDFNFFVVLCIRLKYAADASASECVKNVSAAAKAWDLAPGGRREEDEATAAASPEQRSEKRSVTRKMKNASRFHLNVWRKKHAN